LDCNITRNPFLLIQENKSFKIFIMRAWTESGKPTEHLEPWGTAGAFSTLRLFPKNHIPFRNDYLQRLIDSAKLLQQPWIPELSEIDQKFDQYLSESTTEDGLIRICLFNESLAISDRPATSDGQPVEGWLMQYRRPVPAAKSTEEKELYGRLSELDTASEDWIIIDPKDNDIRETATANLIFVDGHNLVIPDKKILQGIILRKLMPILSDSFSITRASPLDQDIAQFEEILLCGTGRGVSPLKELSELGWTSRSDLAFSQVRKFYNNLVDPTNA
jgi:branched-subunit amino acid aminotransferase/4-amino-4-deoxychorismate lyase